MAEASASVGVLASHNQQIPRMLRGFEYGGSTSTSGSDSDVLLEEKLAFIMQRFSKSCMLHLGFSS